MNKIVASISLSMVFFAVALVVVPDIALADKPTYARVRPVAYYYLKWLDHTYVCYKGSKERCFANYGGHDGGSKLSDAGGNGDTDLVSCVHDEGKDKNGACYQKERVEAVCHQESNLGLAHTGKTVHNASGYSFSWVVFGTNGLSPNVPGCLKKCKAK